MNQHIDITKNECKLCNKKFNSYSKVRNHIAYNHTSNNEHINSLIAAKHPLTRDWGSLKEAKNTTDSMLDKCANVTSNIAQKCEYSQRTTRTNIKLENKKQINLNDLKTPTISLYRRKSRFDKQQEKQNHERCGEMLPALSETEEV